MGVREQTYIYVSINCMQYITEQNFNSAESFRMSGGKYQSQLKNKSEQPLALGSALHFNLFLVEFRDFHYVEQENACVKYCIWLCERVTAYPGLCFCDMTQPCYGRAKPHTL